MRTYISVSYTHLITIRVKEVEGNNRFDQIVTMIEESEKLKSELEGKAEHYADKLEMCIRDSFMAARSFPGVTFGPNCPTNAGATAA